MKKKFIYIIIAVLTLGMTSCSKYLDVTPSDKQTAAQLFASKAGYYAAQNGIYDALASDALYGKQMTWEAIEIMSQSYATQKASTLYQNLSVSNYTEINSAQVLSSIWQKAYETILAANVLMDQIDKQDGVLTKPEADLMKGEMLAVRAYLHLDMLRLFGPPPSYGLDADAIPYNESSNVSALDLLTINEVVAKIIRDLDQAEELLKNDPIIENGPMMSEPEDGSSVQNRYRQYRFNYYAVKALKARAYLWGGDNANARKYALELINDQKVQDMFPVVNASKLLANPTNPDRVFSSEVFMGIYDKDRDNVYNNFFASSAPVYQLLQPRTGFIAGGSNGLFTHLLLGPETSDYRFQGQWEASTNGVNTHCFAKYKKIDQPDPSDMESEYYYAKMIPLLKMQELYYIACETSEDPNEMVSWYNEARMRRGLPNLVEMGYAPTLAMYWPMGYGPIFLSNEYRREFWGEGQWFFFAKRVPVLADAMGYTEAGYSYYSENGYLQNMVQFDPTPALPSGEMK